MQQDHHVGVLLDAVVQGDAVGDEVVHSQDRGVVDLLLAERLDRGDGVPVDVVGGQHLELGVSEHLGDASHPLTTGRVLPHRGAAERGAHRRRELTVGHALLGQDLPHPSPDLLRDRVQVGVGAYVAQGRGDALDLLTAGTVDADVVAEAQLVLRTHDVDVEAVAIALLAHPLDPGEDVVAGQQPSHVVGKTTACRGVVDPAHPPLLGEVDAAVRGPEVTQEQPDLLLGESEDPVRHELLVTAQAEQTVLVEPRGDRVATSAREPERGGQAKRGHPCRGVLVADRGDAEPPARSIGDRGQVRLVDARVADRLALDEGAVTQEVGQDHDLVGVPGGDRHGGRDVTHRPDTRSHHQLGQRDPAVVGQERVVARRLHAPARRQSHLEDLLGA